MVVSNKKGLVRPVVARDGTIYYLRRLHAMSGSQGVYLPKTVLESVKWSKDDVVMIWCQKDVVCLKKLEIEGPATRLIVIPPRGRRGDTVGPDDEA